MKKRMTWKEIENKSKEIVVNNLDIDPEWVTLDASFVEDFGADSIDLIELYMAFEEEFDISIPVELGERMTSLGSAFREYLTAFPREALTFIESKVLCFQLRPDGLIEVVLQLEDGSWTFADGKTLLPSLIYAFTLSKWGSVLKQLQDLVNDPKTREEDLQKFFEEFPELIAGDDYDAVIPQATISREDGNPWRADFVLAPINQTEFCKVLELKVPDIQLTNRPRRGHMTFAAKVWQAICQIQDYARAFDAKATRERFKQHYGTDVYKPDMHLIAGRRWTLEWLDSIRELRRSTEVRIEDWDSFVDRLKRSYG